MVGGAGGADPGQRRRVGVGDGAGHAPGGGAVRDDPQVPGHQLRQAVEAVALRPARVGAGRQAPPGEGGFHRREIRGGGARVGRGHQGLVEDGSDGRAGPHHAPRRERAQAGRDGGQQQEAGEDAKPE